MRQFGKIFKGYLNKRKILKGQFINKFKMLSLKCTIDGHEEQQIIGICENVNCTSQRKVCLDCIQIHQQNDKSFMMSDIKNEQGLQKIFDEFKENNINKINNIYIQCFIQQYFLYIQMIEYIKQTMLKYQQLTNIINDLDKFKKETWYQINTSDYIQKNNNIGAQTYLQQNFYLLDKINLAKDEYLVKINDIFIDQSKQVVGKYEQNQIIDQFIESIQQNMDNLLKSIISNDLYKKESENKFPSKEIFRIIKIQDQELKSDVLYKQYAKIDYLIRDDGIRFLFKINLDSFLVQNNKEKSIQLYNNALTLQQNKKYKESIEIFDQAINLDPYYVNAYYNKAYSLQQLQKYQEAIEMYDQVIKLEPNNSEGYNRKGNQLCYLKRIDEANIQYQQAIQLDPKSSIFYCNQGTTFNDLQRYHEAIEMFDLAIQLNSKYALAYHHKGGSFINLQRYQEALFLYEEAIKLDPKYIQSYINKGITLNHLRRYEEGIQMFDQAIKLGSQNALLYHNKGNSLYHLKRYQEAIQIYDQAIKLDPKHVETYLQKGITLNDLLRYQEAIQMFNKVIQLDNKSAVAYINKGYLLLLNLATSLYQLKRYNESIQMYDQAIKLDPQYRDTFKAFSLSQLKRLEKNELIKNSMIVFLSLFILIIVVMKLI